MALLSRNGEACAQIWYSEDWVCLALLGHVTPCTDLTQYVWLQGIYVCQGHTLDQLLSIPSFSA